MTNADSANDIRHDRFYLYNDGESAHLFCGRCVEQLGGDIDLYSELHQSSTDALEQGFTRVCAACDRNAWEVEHAE